MAHSLDRLNDRERELLILLAQGHTAKTAADMLGLSVNGVNERLRSARRKTDALSSRDLARALADSATPPASENIPQENRHDFFGVEDALPAPSGSIPARGVLASVLHKGWKPMMITTALMAAGLLAVSTAEPMGQATVQPPAVQTGADYPFQPAPGPAELRATLQAESRDEAWASTTEAEILAVYDALPDRQALETLSVTCARTLCEATGVTRTGLDADTHGRLVMALQSTMIDTPEWSRRLTRMSNAFGASQSGSGQTVFATYWQRLD